MYPYVSDLFSDLFGFEFPIPIYSFGLMVATGAMVAAWLLQKELERMYRTGWVDGVRIPDPESKKKGGKRPIITASPAYLVGTITMIALIAGFAGAKVFHILENLDEFFAAPGRMLLSRGGFTFYGGLIVGGFVVVRYVRKKGLPMGRVADAAAPGVMLAYGIGRIGCHLAGDGDWGVVSNIAAKPDWIPMWLWAETYPNNILNVDLSSTPVYPTSIYEFLMAVAIFGVLWRLRKHTHMAGWLFWVYLLMNGVERFMIEQIRVNNVFHVFGVSLTQAEMIASALVIVGLIGIWKTWKPGKSSGQAASVRPESGGA